MAVPDYQSIMLPFLQIAGDGQEHYIGDVVDQIANHFGLSEEDRRDRVPSGTKFRLDDRVAWARAYMKQAGLIEPITRGYFRITQRGLDVLNSGVTAINVRYLQQFPEFVAFQERSRRSVTDSTDLHPQDEINDQKTPVETLEEGYQALRNELAASLIERIKTCSPRFFERLVVDLLVAMGYGGSRKDAGRAIGQSGDGGIDGIINEDRLGLDVVYIQAKRWENTVGRPVVQAFADSLEGVRARKGVMITTSSYSKEAKDYVERIEKRIILIDGIQLAQYMMDYNIGATEVATYTVKKMDLDYFGEDE